MAAPLPQPSSTRRARCARRDRGILRHQGIIAPDFFAWVVTIGELVGGVFLIIGLLTRLVAIAFFVEMVLTTLIVKLNVGLIAMGGAGAELDLALLAAMAAVAVYGPGSLSVDRNIGLESRVAAT